MDVLHFQEFEKQSTRKMRLCGTKLTRVSTPYRIHHFFRRKVVMRNGSCRRKSSLFFLFFPLVRTPLRTRRGPDFYRKAGHNDFQFFFFVFPLQALPHLLCSMRFCEICRARACLAKVEFGDIIQQRANSAAFLPPAALLPNCSFSAGFPAFPRRTSAKCNPRRLQDFQSSSWLPIVL